MKKNKAPTFKFCLSTECWALLFLATVGCMSPQKGPREGVYHESSMNDLNQAPSRFSPPGHENSLDQMEQHPANIHSKADYYFTMGEAYALEGQSRKSIEAYKSVLLYDPESPTVYLRIAVESLKLGMASEAINYCEAALKIDDTRVDAHMLLGGLYTSIKAYDGAIKEYENVLRMDPSNSEAPLYLGAVFAEKKQYKKALSYFAKLVTDEDNRMRYLVEYYMGRVYQEMKLMKEAEAAFNRSIDLKSDFYDALVALGSLYEVQGKTEKEIDLYVKFQRENGPHSVLAETLAQIFLGRKDYARALEQLQLLEELDDDLLSVKIKIALIYVEQKDYPRAVSKLEQTLEMAPESDKVRFYLAALFEEMKQPENAIKYFQEVPVDSNFYSESVIHAAYLLKQQGDLVSAKNTLEKGLESKPESPQMYSLYSSIMDSLGEYEPAARQLEKGIGRFPGNTQLLFYYGMLSDKMGQREIMLKTMKKLIDVDPKNTQAINYLAYTYAEEATNLSEAEALARRALQLSPEDPFVMDTLGWVLYKQGRIKEAITWLESAHQQQPKESVIADHLGDAYIRHNLPEKAKQMYRRAMDVEADRDRQRRIEIKLTDIDSIKPQERLPASVLNPPPVPTEK